MQGEIAAFLKKSEGLIAKTYAQNIPPKWALQCGASLVSASVSIQLKAEGGVHTYSHKRMACRHAWEQARLDLASGQVEAAILCAVSSHEDPIVLERLRQMNPERSPTEGAAIAVLTRSGPGWEIDLNNPPIMQSLFFGIADPLIQALWRRE